MNINNSRPLFFSLIATTVVLRLCVSSPLAGGQTAMVANVAYHNVRVNQDHSKYPKSVAGGAIDPDSSLNIVVSENDSRLNNIFTHDFFYVTRDGGIFWKDDIDTYPSVTYDEFDTGAAPAQRSRGVAFDNTGHSYTALDVDPGVVFYNSSAVAVSVGLNHGTYADTPVIVDSLVCGVEGTELSIEDPCSEKLKTQGIAVDNSATASNGTIYVHYSLICNVTYPCGDLVSGAAVTAVAKSPGYNQPFTVAGIWSLPASSGTYSSVSGASEMAIDIHGTPYLFFSDLTNSPRIDLWQSTNGTTKAKPFVEFLDTGLNNLKWKFGEDKQFQCAEHNGTGYCAFMATQVGTATAAATPSIFLAAIDLADGKAKLTRVNNDSFTGGKDHFNPSVAVTPDGDIYVGWFDNRKDPSNLKVDYFVGKSTDGGKTFPGQHAVNDVSFDPTIGVVGPSGAIVAKPQGGVKAFWADTRDGATQQIWSEDVK